MSLDYSRLLEWSGGIVFAIIANYLQLRWQVTQVTKQINGIGSKLKDLAKDHVETEKDVSYMQGYLQGASNGLFKPKE